MKIKWNNALKMLLLLVTGIITGFVLLTAVFALPVSGMETNIRRSADAIEQENGTTSELLPGYSATYDGIFTDCLMLQNAVYTGSHNTVQAAMGVYRSETDPAQWHPADSLIGYLEGSRASEVSYARYWHGYLVVLKPLLLFLNVQEIKMLNMMLLGAACFLITAELYRKGRGGYAWAFLASVFLMVPLSAVLSLSQAICAYLAFGAVLFQVKREEWLRKGMREAGFFLITGMMTSYFDFLTYPLATLGFPLVMILISRQKGKEAGKPLLKKAVTDCICWSTGYFCMWASKWFLASAVLHVNVLSDAAGTMAERTSSIENTSRLLAFFNVVFRNMKEISGMPYKWLAALLVCWLILRFLKIRMHRKPQENSAVYMQHKTEGCSAYLFTALLPFLWYALTINHSEEHAVFTFRILGIAVFSMLSMMLELTDGADAGNAEGKIGN